MNVLQSLIIYFKTYVWEYKKKSIIMEQALGSLNLILIKQIIKI